MAYPDFARSLLCLALLAARSAPGQGGPGPGVRLSPEASRLNNLGTAYMNQQQMDRAAGSFGEAFKLRPGFSIALSNQGIAYFYMQQNQPAEDALRAALAIDASDPHTWYALGLLYRSENRLPEALEAFRKVLALHPADPDTLYMTGSLLADLGEFEQASQQFRLALVSMPTHASALFGLARVERRLGHQTSSQAAFDRFKLVSAQKLSAQISHAYGEEGLYSRVEESAGAPSPVAPMIPVTFSLAARATLAAATGRFCLLPLGGKSGVAEVVLAEGAQALQLFHVEGTATRPTLAAGDAAGAGLEVGGKAVACAAGDYDNDGKTDLAVAVEARDGKSRLLLFHNDGGGHFHESSKMSGLAAGNRPSGLLFVDFDHDGDLDLLATGSAARDGQAANTLWRNDGNGSFTDWTQQAALGGASATVASTLSDLNNDRAVDLITVGKGPSPDLYLNRREGAFLHRSLYAEKLPATTGVLTLDYDKDGAMDVLVTHSGAPAATLWHSVQGGEYARVPLPLAGAIGASAAAAIDFDNDGWLDLAIQVQTASGRNQVRLLRNKGPAGWEDVSAALGLDRVDLQQPRQLAAVDLRGTGAADLLIAEEGKGLVLLANEGGSRNHSLSLSLAGLADNKNAIGTKVEVAVGGVAQKFEITAPLPLLAGLGSASRADFVRLLWPTGVPQDEIDIAAGKPLEVPELDRRGSSCPTLFSWDGNGFRFVTDVIGAGVIGHWVAPAQRNVPDPDEWVHIDGDKVHPLEHRVSLRFGEPMEEVNFLDQVRLIAIDHPQATLAVPQEAFLSEPPFASGVVVISAAPHPAAGAWDDKGRDVLPLLSRANLSSRQYLRDFENLPFAGFANRHSLTLDLGAIAPGEPVRLLLHGYVEYFSASSMYSAWQAGLSPLPPFVEAQLPDGRWVRIVDDMGFPAGLPRTVVADLTGKLPAGAHRVRITTNLQIYWDQVMVDHTPQTRGNEKVRSTELPLAAAQLAFRGYPRQVDLATPGDLTYDYAQLSPTGPFLPHRGRYTRYGDVTPLLHAVDDEYVIFGTGEDIDLEFDAGALPDLKPGWKRDYFFYANGFVKDMDFYEADPFEVGPLPFHGMTSYPYGASEHYPDDPGHLAYQLNYNTRFESGSAARPLSFHYAPAASRPVPVGATH